MAPKRTKGNRIKDGACALLLLASVAQGQVPARDTQRVPVLLTISGGVSLGAYEAGLTWGLLEVFKLTARDSLRRAWNLPRYHLSVVAGLFRRHESNRDRTA
jgi:hypothetical protein